MANFTWALPTLSAVLLIPQIHDPYKLDIIVKVNKQAFKRYKVTCQLFVCTEKDYLNNVPIPPPLLSVMTALIKVTFGAADLMRVVMFRLYSFTVTVQGLTDSC